MNKFLRSVAVVCGCILLCVLASCTKTETVAPPVEAQNRILSYKIVNVQGEPIYGSINDQNNMITVYLPFYKTLTVLDPEIEVSAGATVNPVSGTLIEDLLDVFRNGRSIKYEVTAKDGTKKTYTLQIDVQQPEVVLEELSSADYTAEYTINTTIDFSMMNFTVRGTGLHEDVDMMSVVLVDEAGEEYPPFGLGITNTGDIYSASVYLTWYAAEPGPGDKAILDKLPATGLYKIRVYSYAKVATMEYPIRINKI